MKKIYNAGDTLVMRIRKSDKEIMEWAAKQSELGDAIRFLIEQEIQSHGITDMSNDIVSKRTPLPTALEIEPQLFKLLKEKKLLTTSEAYEELAEFFQVTDEERKRTVRSGSQPQCSMGTSILKR